MTSYNFYPAELEDHIKTCPCCKSVRWNLFGTTRYSHGNLNYQICSTCGLIFQSPRMSEEQRKVFYAESYRLFAFGQTNPPKVDLEIQDGRARHLAKIVSNRYSGLEGKDHLDIGCGSGALIRRFIEIVHCTGAGIEPDDSYRKYAQSQGLDVFASLNEWKNCVGRRVKIVTLSHVLEHVPDPLAFLVYIKDEVLSDDGILLVEVPHLYFHPYFDLAHILAFSPHTIRQVLRMGGFKVMYFKTHGHPVRITPRYMTILTEITPSCSQSEMVVQSEPGGVKLKRLLGLSFDFIETKLRQLIKRRRNMVRRLQAILNEKN